jgi:hypothetical protein
MHAEGSSADEAAVLTDQQLSDFFDYIDECAKGREERLVRTLRVVAFPADMSQLLVCVNMAPAEKKHCIGKSKACMSLFSSWMQVLAACSTTWSALHR